MHKKLITTCMAIAAFAAFVAASAASASPVLTENGSKVAVGSSIVGTNTGETEFSGGFNVNCNDVELLGSVTVNTGTQISGSLPFDTFEGTGAGAATWDCTSALGDTKWTVNSNLCFETVAATDNVKITGCSGASITFSLNVTAVITCRYSTFSVTGTYKTNADATINVENQPATEEEPRSFFCPDEGKLRMDLDLTRANGTTLTIS